MPRAEVSGDRFARVLIKYTSGEYDILRYDLDFKEFVNPTLYNVTHWSYIPKTED